METDITILDEKLSYDTRKRLGRGPNSDVFKGKFEDIPVAVKWITYERSCDAEESPKEVAERREREIMNMIEGDRHQNIIGYYYSFSRRDSLFLAMQLCDGNLKHYVENKNLISTYAPQRVNHDIAAAVEYLHRKGVVHRDLKPENVFYILREKKIERVLVGDFGLSKVTRDDSYTFTGRVGTHGYIPHEIISLFNTKGCPASSKVKMTVRSDMFSMGCIFHYTATLGQSPFGQFSQEKIARAEKPDFQYLKPTQHNLLCLLEKILSHNPDERPDAAFVLNHPAFWTADKILSFLKNASDDIEAKAHTNQSVIADLENPDIGLGKAWFNSLPVNLRQHLATYQRDERCIYRTNSINVRSALRIIRNVANHHKDFSKEVREELGNVPEGHVDLWMRTCPSLFMHVYNKMNDIRPQLGIDDTERRTETVTQQQMHPPQTYTNRASQPSEVRERNQDTEQLTTISTSLRASQPSEVRERNQDTEQLTTISTSLRASQPSEVRERNQDTEQLTTISTSLRASQPSEVRERNQDTEQLTTISTSLRASQPSEVRERNQDTEQLTTISTSLRASQPSEVRERNQDTEQLTTISTSLGASQPSEVRERNQDTEQLTTISTSLGASQPGEVRERNQDTEQLTTISTSLGASQPSEVRERNQDTEQLKTISTSLRVERQKGHRHHLTDDIWMRMAKSEIKTGRKSEVTHFIGQNYILCVDISESMAEDSAWDQTKQFVEDFMNSLENVQTYYSDIPVYLALVTFGLETKVVQRLTNEIHVVKEAIDRLCLGGPTPMSGGITLGTATAGIPEHCRCKSKLIVVTDGKPTATALYSGPDTSDAKEKEEARSNVIKLLGDFKSSIDFIFVPVGNPDSEFINVMKGVSGGMVCSYTGGHDILKRQISEDSNWYYESKNSLLPSIGSRVIRGIDWTHENQDHNGPGTVIGHKPEGNVIWVEWDADGHVNCYSYGVNGKYDVLLTDEYKRRVSETGAIFVGCVVTPEEGKSDRRSPAKIGTVIKLLQGGGKVEVRWEDGTRGEYSFGQNNIYEIWPYNPDSSSHRQADPTPPGSTGKKEFRNKNAVMRKPRK